MSTFVMTDREVKTARETAPATTWFERGAPISGIAFVVLMVVGSMLWAMFRPRMLPDRSSPTTLPTAALTHATSSAGTSG
jgi:hypothetical protein